jgi:hypothetical protein
MTADLLQFLLDQNPRGTGGQRFVPPRPCERPASDPVGLEHRVVGQKAHLRRIAEGSVTPDNPIDDPLLYI